MTWFDPLLNPVVLATLITVGLGGGVLPKLVAAIWRAFTGHAGRQRAEVDRIRADLVASDESKRAAWRELDSEMSLRRRTQEALSGTRSVAMRYGAPESELPTVPSSSNRQE